MTAKYLSSRGRPCSSQAIRGVGNINIEGDGSADPGRAYITGSFEALGDVDSEGKIIVGIDTDGIDRIETQALKSTSFGSVDCSSNGKKIKIYVQLDVTTDFSWRMPVRSCSKFRLSEMLSEMADQLSIDPLFATDWDATFKSSRTGRKIFNSDTLASHSIGTGDVITMSVGASHLSDASIAFYGAEFSGFTADGGEAVFLGDFVDINDGVDVLAGSYFELKGKSELVGPIDSAGEISS